MKASATLMLPPSAPAVAPWPRRPLPSRVPTTSDPEAPNVQSLARTLLLLCCLSLLMIASPPGTVARQGGGAAADAFAAEHLPQELLVGLRPGHFDGTGVVAPSVSAAFDRFLGAFGVETAGNALPDASVYRLHFAPDTDLRAKRRAFAGHPGVAFAEPNYILTAQLTPNDPIYQQQQWALPKIAADRAWDITTGTTGSPVTVAILDTGASPTHPDLAGRLVPGYDFVNSDADASDDNGHGTFTAGIVGASGNNGIGVAGVSWGARLMPVKILNDEGRGPVSAFSAGIRYAVDNGARVINVSAGVPFPTATVESRTMEEAVRYATGKGAIVVAASGNVGNDVVNYPAAYPEVIAVGASTQSDEVAPFSSYGPYVSVAAPGVGIVSSYYRDGDTYAQLSGTSAAAPFVAGTVALMLSLKPQEVTGKSVREILKATAVDILTPGFDPRSGYGRLDTYHALVLAANPPATLTGATVTPATARGNDPFLLNAAGFAPSEPATVWITFADGSYRYYRYPSVFADARGQLQVSLATSEPMPIGAHRVTAYGETSRRVASATFTVTQTVTQQAIQAFPRVPPVPDTDTKVYFAATGHTLGGSFLEYWRANGGLAIFGYPLSEEFTELNPSDGKPYTVQYFERNRFEYHPENEGTPYNVLLGLLGRDLTAGRAFPPGHPPERSIEPWAYFPQTQHTLSGEFLAYWEAHGGLALFGYPISEPLTEVSKTDGKTYTVQYFERNRFELHPENQAPFNVLLGLLGTDSARAKGYLK